VAEFRASLDGDFASRFDPHIDVIHGEAVDVIPRHAEELDAEFLLIGTGSRTGVGGLVMGNTVEEILKRVECSVIAVKPEGFESPVEAE
jgi:nucleotide-binding universal stress UspA family protein